MQIAILMCTYNGQRFLAEQMASFAAQTHPQWTVWVSDDGSTDGTRGIVEGAGVRLGQVFAGPQRGFARNFLSLTCQPGIQAPAYAFADQDDIWYADKLERAAAWLRSVPDHVPALYCSRSELIDGAGATIGFSHINQRPPSFGNALMQPIAGANTMVFNHAARQLVVAAGADLDIVSHDWWLYLLVMGCGGQVYCDQTPSLKYRQHVGNAVGSVHNPLVRLGKLLDGELQQALTVNLAALERAQVPLTPANAQTLATFQAARRSGLIGRLVGMRAAKVYKQTLKGNISLLIAAFSGRI